MCSSDLLFACEDNGIGISTRTPDTFVARMMEPRTGIKYFACDSQDYPGVWATAQAAIEYVRTQRRPAFVHTKTVRLMGHAGSDVEANYRTLDEIEANEARDPMRGFADLLLRSGALTPAQILAIYKIGRAHV